jgi:hypothetical protein
LGTTIANQNLVQEEMKRRLNSGNTCYLSVQNLLSSRLLSKNIKIRIYISMILPVVLYGCETWSVTLKVMGEWMKLHNEELHNLYSSPNIMTIIKSMRMRMAGHVARMGEKRNAYRILVGKPEGKRPIGRQRRRRVDKIKMYLRAIGWDGMAWIGLAQDRDQ